MKLAFGGISYLLVLWLQNVRGYGAVKSLPADLGRSVTTAVEAGFSHGIADAVLVTAGIVLAALVTVRLLWPGRPKKT